jgi:hypothetical protein
LFFNTAQKRKRPFLKELYIFNLKIDCIAETTQFLCLIAVLGFTQKEFGERV